MLHKNIWPKQNRAEMNAYYGDPDPNGNGSPDPHWELQNIVRITPPYPMKLAWNPAQQLKTISVHKKCAESLKRALIEIAHNVTVQDIVNYQLDHYGGCYMFRAMRGSHNLSIHSWGAAIDISPAINSFGAIYGSKINMMPKQVVDIFAAEGWAWGGLWNTGDAQHFQAALV